MPSILCLLAFSRKVPLVFFSFLIFRSLLCLAEHASSDQTAGADPNHPDSTDPGRGARDDPEGVCCYSLFIQRGRQYVSLQKCGKAAVYAHVGLPSTLWTGVYDKGSRRTEREQSIHEAFLVTSGFSEHVLSFVYFSAGVSEVNCVPEVHRQTNRLFGSYAAVR